MASEPVPTTRGDVAIEYDSIPAPGPDASELSRLLQETCAEATHPQRTQLWQLAESCVYFGTIKKKISSPTASSAPAPRLAPHPWGTVLTTWTTPTKLDPFVAAAATRVPQTNNQDEDRVLFQLAEDFRQRVLTSDERHPLLCEAADIASLGALHKHGTFFLHRHDAVNLVDVYLFEHKLVFTTPETLRVEYVVDLCDIGDLSHERAGPNDFIVYRLELAIRDTPDTIERCTIFTSNEPQFLIPAWSAAIGHLVTRTRGGSPSPDTGRVPVMGTFVNDWLPPDVPLDDPSTLRFYKPVRIHEDHTGSCGAYLFDDALVFIYKDVYGALHIHRRIALAAVEHIADKSNNNHNIVRVALEPEDGVQLAYNFRVRTRALVAEWLQELEMRLVALKPGHSFRLPDRAPKPDAWALAGVVFLAPAGVAGEYTVGVGILPRFASAGLATHALRAVLQNAFETLGAHRVEARVLRGAARDPARALATFLRLGFAHEGVRRAAALVPTTQAWADVSVLAMLDMDWHMRAYARPPPGGPWDEMFARHQREREKLGALDSGAERAISVETEHELRAALYDDGSSSASSVRTRTTSTTTSWDAISELPDDGLSTNVSSYSSVDGRSVSSFSWSRGGSE
ncbi:hypothetical protein AURDEDRAFT_145564 [Auricularia subglabra TFB-10046 SS5]|nr:hypothetical protein AURDEDRAFT_145564 [Auricularia subglabra TFB-10046 SS5]